jgi:hypothetical protein
MAEVAAVAPAEAAEADQDDDEVFTLTLIVVGGGEQLQGGGGGGGGGGGLQPQSAVRASAAPAQATNAAAEAAAAARSQVLSKAGIDRPRIRPTISTQNPFRKPSWLKGRLGPGLAAFGRKGRAVFHSNTQAMINHWRALRGAAPAPAREAIDPADLAEILTQVFLLGRTSPVLPFRLAGGLLTDLHGRSLRGESFLDLWGWPSRAAVRDAVVSTVRDREPVVIYADAAAAGGVLELEIFLAPLAGPEGVLDRLLGLYQPLGGLDVLRGEPVGPLAHRFALRLGAGLPQPPRLRLAAVNGLPI